MFEIKTGMVEIPVERDGKSVGAISFNPEDLAFVDRFYGLIQSLEEKESDLKKKEEVINECTDIDTYGLPVNLKERVALSKEVCTFMRTELDSVFGVGTSQTVFGDYNSPQMFEQFFNEITPHIQTARAEKVSKYTNRAQRRASGKKVME